MIDLSCLQGRNMGHYFNFNMCRDLHSEQRLRLRPQELSPTLLEASETLWKAPPLFLASLFSVSSSGRVSMAVLQFA